jgi:hypothetical protein
MQFLECFALSLFIFGIQLADVGELIKHPMHQVGELMLDPDRQIFVCVVAQSIDFILLREVLVCQFPDGGLQYLESSCIYSLLAAFVVDSMEERIQVIALLLADVELVTEEVLLLLKICLLQIQVSNSNAHPLDELGNLVRFILDLVLESRKLQHHVVDIL